jgi:hypothetical protein
MGHQRVWRQFGLVLALVLVALPASAGERQGRRSRSLAGEAWVAVVRWVAPASWAKLGRISIRMASAASRVSGSGFGAGDKGDLGPAIEPNG